MKQHISLSLTIAAMFICDVSEGHPYVSRSKKSAGAEDTSTESAIGESNAEHLPQGQIASENDANRDELPLGVSGRDSLSGADNAPSDDGLFPTLGSKPQQPSQGGGPLSLLPGLFGGGEGGGKGFGGGGIGPMAILGGFSALVMPLGGSFMNNLPGAFSSLMGSMQNLGSLTSFPGIGGASG